MKRVDGSLDEKSKIKNSLSSMGKSLKPTFVLLMSLIQILFLRSNFAFVDQQKFESAISNYETQVEKLIYSQKPKERANALISLARIDSSLYPAARDFLLYDKSLEVQIALLEAIKSIGDRSPSAQKVVERGFLSEEKDVLGRVHGLELNFPKFKIKFKNIWRKDKATYFFTEYIVTHGWGDWTLFVDVVEAKPWLDPAFKELKVDTQITILFRAGLKESINLALDLILKSNPRFVPYCIGELKDIDYIRFLLNSDKDFLRKYASTTLISVKDDGFAARLNSAIEEYKNHSPQMTDAYLDSLNIEFALPLLDEAHLRMLLSAKPNKWFSSVSRQLASREKPLTYDELTKMNVGGFNFTEVNFESLFYSRLDAISREKRYEEIPEQIDIAIASRDRRELYLSAISRLFKNEEFKAKIPEPILKECQNKIKNLMNLTPKDGGLNYWREKEEANELLLNLYTSQEIDEAWKSFITSDDPFGEKNSFGVVVRGFTDKCDSLRDFLSNYQSCKFLSTMFGNRIMSYIGDKKEGRIYQPVCNCKDEIKIVTFDFPEYPSTIKKLSDEFIKDIKDAQVTNEEEFIEAFLKDKGVLVSENDLFPLLSSPDYIIRHQAELLVIKKTGISNFPLYYEEDNRNKWLKEKEAVIKEKLEEKKEKIKTLSEEEEKKLNESLLKIRKKYFDQIVDGLNHPLKVVGDKIPGYNESVSVQIWQPSSVFITDAGVQFENEIRALLNDKDPKIRHSAAYALWEMFRDEKGLEVFKEDAKSEDVNLKASSLYTLQLLVRNEMAPFYPPLLKSKEPILKQVGIAGVATFKIKEALPYLLKLALDMDPQTASLSILTFGEMRLKEAKPFLLKLILEQSSLAPYAAIALTNFRTSEDIEEFISYALKEETPLSAKEKLIWIVIRITGRPGIQYFEPYSSYGVLPKQTITKETLKDWQRWFKEHKDDSPDKRFHSVVEELVETTLAGDEKRSRRARSTLSRWGLMESAYFLEGSAPLNEQNKEKLRKWWNDAKNRSGWDLLKNCNNYNDELFRFCLDINENLTKKMAFTKFYFLSVGDTSYKFAPFGGSDLHAKIVKLFGVDFGNPNYAKGDVKEKVLSDWLNWAEREGLIDE